MFEGKSAPEVSARRVANLETLAETLESELSMRLMALCLGAALGAIGCGTATEVSDYDAGVVIKGTVLARQGDPVVGAAVQIEAYRDGCNQESLHVTGGGVFTTAAGEFEGDYSLLSTGPVFVNCIGVEVLDTLSFAVVGDTLVTGTVRLDAARSDTLEIDLEV